jgi:hypothetical protein
VSGAYIRTPDFVLMTSGSYVASTCFFLSYLVYMGGHHLEFLGYYLCYDRVLLLQFSCFLGRGHAYCTWVVPLIRDYVMALVKLHSYIC